MDWIEIQNAMLYFGWMGNSTKTLVHITSYIKSVKWVPKSRHVWDLYYSGLSSTKLNHKIHTLHTHTLQTHTQSVRRANNFISLTKIHKCIRTGRWGRQTERRKMEEASGNGKLYPFSHYLCIQFFFAHFSKMKKKFKQNFPHHCVMKSGLIE